jgi:hypothetical protein
MKKINLKNVTLVSVSSIKIEETIFAILESMKGVDYFDVVLISHEEPKDLPAGISFKKCDKLNSISDYNKFILFDLCDYIESEFSLIVQYDGYVLNSKKWDNSFLKYDYIGAPWRNNIYFNKSGVPIRVGNGGFSLRSKKVLNIFRNLEIKDCRDIIKYNEDGVICVYFREEIEDMGINFAPISVASNFSCEQKLPCSKSETFGFHTFKSDFNSKFKNFLKIFFSFFGIKIRKVIKK